MTTPNKTGLPPGTLIYLGEQRTEKIKITVLQYNENTFIEKDFYDIPECFSFVESNSGMIKWINVDGIHNIQVVEEIGRLFNIHPLTLEDIVNTNQRPKFEEYDNYVVSVMKMLYYDSEIHAEQLCILLKENLVISFQEVHGGDAFDVIRTRIRLGKGKIRKAGADYLAYCLIDAVVDFYFTLLEKTDERIELLEEELMGDPSREILNQLHHMKREMIFLRKAVWPMREMINSFQRSDSNLIHQSTEIYLRDVHDHTIRIIDTVETFRDLLSSMMDIYLSSMSNKMNEVMKVLTIISTIFIPVTFIAGVYGMNFDYMPELHSPLGYIITWIVMLSIMIYLLLYFKRKKWL